MDDTHDDLHRSGLRSREASRLHRALPKRPQDRQTWPAPHHAGFPSVPEQVHTAHVGLGSLVEEGT